MAKRTIGIITDNRTGVALAGRFKNFGYNTIVCLNDDSNQMGNSLKHSLADQCDSMNIPVSLDQISFSSMIGDSESIVFFVKIYGEQNVSSIENFVNILPARTIYANCGNGNYKKITEISSYFVKKNVLYTNISIISSESVSETGPVFLICGEKIIYSAIKTELETVSAKYEGTPCCYYFSNYGIGSFIRSVHDGAFRSLINMFADAVTVLNKILGYSYGEIHDFFLSWNDTLLKSNAIVLISDILSRTESGGENYLVDSVDVSRNLALNTNIQNIGNLRKYYPNLNSVSAVNNFRASRELADEIKNLNEIVEINSFKKNYLTDAVFKSCRLTMLCIFEQSFGIIDDYCKNESVTFDYAKICKAFYAGGQLTSTLLKEITGYFEDGALPSDIFDLLPVKRTILNYIKDLRNLICAASEDGISVPMLCSSLNYFDSMTNDSISGAFLQLAYDCIYDTGYYRKGKENLFAADWGSLSRETESVERIK